MSLINNMQSLTSRLRVDRKGSVAIIFTFAMMPMIFAAGSAIDYGRAQRAKATLQAAADAAALGASAILGGSTEVRTAKAQQIFTANLPAWMKGQGGATAVVTPTLSNVTVTASYATPTTFMRLANVNEITTSANSNVLIDTTVTDGSVCLLALNPSANVSGIALGGNSTIADQGCWAWSNSTSVSLGLNAWGSSDATAAGFCSAGGVSGSSRFVPTPLTQCAQQPDPFATLAMPAIGGCDYNNKQYGQTGNQPAITVVPNASGITVFCGGLEVKPQADVTFPAGIYVIKDKEFLIRAQSIVRGTGVVFVFSGAEARLHVNGGGGAILKAPTVGATGVLAPYPGFLFIDNRNNKPTAVTDITGGGDLKLEGIVYQPSRALNVGGNGYINQTSKYFAMVADSYYLNGTGDLYLKTDFATASFPDILPKVKRLTRITHSQ